MTIQVGKRAGNAIVPINNVTKKTKVVTESTFSITATDWTTAYARVWCEADSNGVYKLFGTAEGDFSSPVTASNFTLITNVTFGNFGVAGQTCQVDIRDAGGVGCSDELEVVRCLKNSTGIFIDVTSVTDVSSVTINFGGVTLASKPSWFDENAENLADVSAYIPPASDSEAGIVTTGAQSLGGLKSFPNGINVTSTAGSFYEEDTFTPYLEGTAGGSVAGTGTYVRIGDLVMYQIDFTSAAISSASGDVRVTGAPLASSSANVYHYASWWSNFTGMWSTGIDTVISIGGGNTYWSLGEQGGGSATSWTSSSGTAYLRFTGFYRI